ncbi:MAG: histidine kinase dimerization/phospho-acceptor domain-containing protein [Kiloniellaceae bacterium]
MSIADQSAARRRESEDEGYGSSAESSAQGRAARSEQAQSAETRGAPARPAEPNQVGAGAMSRSYAEVLRTSVDWLWQTDADLNLTYVSHSLDRHADQSDQAWIGRSLLGIARSEAGDATPSPLLVALRARRPFRDCTVEWTSDRQQTVRFRLTGLPYYDRQTGGFAGYRGTGSATTESREDAETARQLLELLKAALSERDQLQQRLAQAGTASPEEQLAGIAHELRTPLNAILGFSELIRDQAFGNDPKRYAEYGASIHSSGLHLLQLVNRILNTAEQESGAHDIQVKALDIAEMVAATIQIFGDKAAAADVALSADVAPDLPSALGDRQMTSQILFHLLSRTIAHAPAGWAAGIRAEPEDDQTVLVTVWDGEYARAPRPPAQQREEAAEGSAEPEDLAPVVLQHLAETMGASLEMTGQPGHGSRASLRLPVAGGRTD